jgi:hypothetical protein
VPCFCKLMTVRVRHNVSLPSGRAGRATASPGRVWWRLLAGRTDDLAWRDWKDRTCWTSAEKSVRGERRGKIRKNRWMRRPEASSTVGPACLQPAPGLVRTSLSDNTLTRLEGSQQSSRRDREAYQTRPAAGLRDTIWGCVDRSDPFSAARFRG